MYEIAVIPGDGIGPEIIEEGKRVLEAAADRHGFNLSWTVYPYGADHYLETGETLPEHIVEALADADAIYLGSVGDPRVEPGVLEAGIVLRIRFGLDQFVNLRPIRLLDGIESPLRGKGPADIDMRIVRENTEDFYVGLGGRVTSRSQAHHEMVRELYTAEFGLDVETDAEELAYQLGVISREGTRRVIEYTFEDARRHGHHRVTSVDKANVITDTYGLWREAAEAVAEDYPAIDLDFAYADATAMWLLKNPEHFEHMVCPNLFGDILTDLGAMIQGGLGLAPGGNINPEGTSMFEPLHGSAPKYTGENVANPSATIWAGAMLLEDIGEEAAAETVMDALETTIREGELTQDLGGSASTTAFGEQVARAVTEDA